MTLPDRIAALAGDLRLEASRLSAPVALDALMARHGIPGVGLAVVHDGRVDWAGGFGVGDVATREPVTEDTLFLAGSISKPVAALCALRLVATGALDLDEDVNERLTSWRVPPNGGWQPRVTLRQLLSHTAGLTVHGFPGYPRDEPAPDLVAVLDGGGNTPPVRVRTLPGLQFSYSGGGYCVMQQLLVDVTGEPFPELASRLALDPLGMESSTYENPLPEPLWLRAAAGHRTAGRRVDGGWHVYPEMAAAGLWTTPADLARFAIGIHRAAAGADGALIPAELTAEMLRPHAPNAPMGLGLLVDGDGPAKRFRHGGDDQGFVAWLAGHAARGLGVVVMTNADAGMWAIEPLLGAVVRAYEWPDDAESREPELRAATRLEIDACAGVYATEEGTRVALERDGGRLVLRFGVQPPVELLPGSPTEWHAVSLALSIRFDMASGRAQTAVLHQDAEYVVDTVLTQIA